MVYGLFIELRQVAELREFITGNILPELTYRTVFVITAAGGNYRQKEQVNVISHLAQQPVLFVFTIRTFNLLNWANSLTDRVISKDEDHELKCVIEASPIGLKEQKQEQLLKKTRIV